MQRRPLGSSSISVSVVALGCWPISGMTSVGVTPEDSRRTIQAAWDVGVNFFDTAFSYGADGESERLLSDVLAGRRAECVIASKAGLHWGPDGKRALDASPERIRWECEQSLKRLRTDYVDLLYLHAPDPQCSIAESAGAFRQLQDQGKTRTVGVSNVSLQQLQEFQATCPVVAVQPAYNMLMRQIEEDLVPYCQAENIAVVPYWPLMKGLLAGKLPRDYAFQPGDGRPKYPMFQGAEWEKNQDLIDELREIAAAVGCTVAQLVVRWTVDQPGITAALCGAKRPDQIIETADAAAVELTDSHRAAIQQALDRRGTPVAISAV
jgi:aryl-alcohol dehydrogenase-like predicted oxidoreductase